MIELELRDRHCLIKATGEITLDELMGGVREAYGFGSAALNILWDLSAASFADLDGAAMRQLQQVAEPMSDLRRGGKSAIIAPGDLEFGLTRLFMSYADTVPFEFRVFRDGVSAREWLGVE